MGYPSVDLGYLRAITDCTGIIQHGTHSVPNRRLGYTTDDNARALIVATQGYELTGSQEAFDLALIYLSYLHHAQAPDNKFRNIMTFQRVWLDEEGTEDCFGRTMWACGYVASSGLPKNIRIVAAKLFESSIGWAADVRSTRSLAYTIVGMHDYLQDNEDAPDMESKVDALAQSLLHGFRTHTDEEWQWYEPFLTYGNAILPLGMLCAFAVTGREAYRDAAVRSIDFLTRTLINDGRLDIIGNDGWYMRGKERALYDQQAIDAGYTVYLYVKAYELLGNREYLRFARIAYDWFFGNNMQQVWVYEPETKGCYDGVRPDGVNLNQGAESIICFLLAQLAMEKYRELAF